MCPFLTVREEEQTGQLGMAEKDLIFSDHSIIITS
jgi:hypothetical protein